MLFEVHVDRLVPEARALVREAARIFHSQTEKWFVGLLVHGSALKGGYISGCSDVDLKLFLRPEAFSESGHLPLEVGTAIHRKLALLDPAPFAYIQCYPVASSGRADAEGWVGPIPGAYHMLAGSLPVPEATREQVVQAADRWIERLATHWFNHSDELLQHGDGHLERRVRYVCTEVWPTLYHFVARRASDPFRVWGMPKQEAINQISADSPLRPAIEAFLMSVRHYYPTKASAESGLDVIVKGQHFLTACAEAGPG